MVDGEAGIGKTTVWLAALEQAQGLGFRVLSTRATSAESVLAYTSLAALLGGVGRRRFCRLPPPQRLAIDRVLLRRERRRSCDRSACCCGRLRIPRRAARRGGPSAGRDRRPAVDRSAEQDDHLVGYAATRRANWRACHRARRPGVRRRGVIAGATAAGQPATNSRASVEPRGACTPFCPSGSAGRSRARKCVAYTNFRAATRSTRWNWGAPWRTHTWSDGTALPSSLAELVRARLAALTADGRKALLAAACLATPTLELIARAADTDTEQHCGGPRGGGEQGHRPNRRSPSYFHPSAADPRRVHRRDAGATAARCTAASPRSSTNRSSRPDIWRSQPRAVTSSPCVRSIRPPTWRTFAERRPPRPNLSNLQWASAAIPQSGGSGWRAITSKQAIRIGRMHCWTKTIDQLATRPRSVGEAMLLHAVVRLHGDSFLEAADLLDRALEESPDNSASRVRILIMLAYALLNGGRTEPAHASGGRCGGVRRAPWSARTPG